MADLLGAGDGDDGNPECSRGPHRRAVLEPFPPAVLASEVEYEALL